MLVLAEADGCVTETDTPAIARVIGLCLLTDEIRPAAQETLHYFHAQGVALKIISGDDEKTVAAIARKVGLSGGAVDASTLADNELPDACERYAVFGRVTPTRKKALVEALKAKGHHVAMTGDGVNDIPALKAADCSIAMAGGADATKQAAQLTLLDANFANMPLIVAEGRRVVGNITRAASLFLVKTLYSFALALLTLLFPVEYPFQPIQLTLISSLTIGLPAFLLTLEPNQDRIQGSFLRTVLTRAIPGAAAVWRLRHGGNGRREFRLGYGGLQDAGGAVRGRGRADDALFRLRPADEAARGGVCRHDRRIRAGGVLFQADFLF